MLGQPLNQVILEKNLTFQNFVILSKISTKWLKMNIFNPGSSDLSNPELCILLEVPKAKL